MLCLDSILEAGKLLVNCVVKCVALCLDSILEAGKLTVPVSVAAPLLCLDSILEAGKLDDSGFWHPARIKTGLDAISACTKCGG